MSIKSGFFNSLAGDRTYFAEDFAMLFQGITGSGILSGVGNMFDFSTNGNMTLSVQSGRAWLDETWTDNDADAVVSFDTADPVLDRYDIVIIEVNKSVDVRQNTIKVITGTPSGDPQLPDLVFTENVKQYGLYTVFIPAGTSIITTTNLTTLIDTPDEIQIVTPSGAPETDPIVGAVSGLVKSDGLGNIGAATEDVDYQGVVAEGPFVDGDKTKLDGLGGAVPETDPIVGAVSGLVKSDGLGNIGAAIEDVDYQGVVAEGPFVDGDKTKLDASVLITGNQTIGGEKIFSTIPAGPITGPVLMQDLATKKYVLDNAVEGQQVPETDPIVGAVNGLVKSDGLGNIGAATEDVDYQGVVAEGPFVDGDKTKLDGLGGGGPETDPIVGAVNGLVKSDGLGNIGAATEDVDYQGVVAEGPFVDGDKTKLDGVESGADKTDAGNVAAAGAAMSGGSFHDTFSDYEAADHIPWGVGGAEKIASDRIYNINKYADTVVSAGVDILRSGGGIQVLTLTANSTLTVDLIQGESLTLHLLGGDTYAVTWPTMVWVGGITPVLTGHDLLVLWFVNGVLYGNYTGPVS